MNKILLRNIKVAVDGSDPAEKAIEIAHARLSKAGVRHFEMKLYKRSVDARKRDAVCYVCTVCADVKDVPTVQKLKALDATILDEGDLDVKYGSEPLVNRPVVVGFGPCGMFAALLLAKHGYRPIVLERGSDVSSRAAAVESFRHTRVLDLSNNIQFGAGGAGTFSDGKLMTRINDPKCTYVLDTLHRFGAPDDILVNARPHIGTDRLLTVVANIDKEIRRLGGDIYYNTTVNGFSGAPRINAVHTNRGVFECSNVIFAVGHSARDTYEMLIKGGFDIVPKSFSVGVRIEHLRENIDKALYGDFAALLPPAEYNLSAHVMTDGVERGVYSFCMCPGGEVVAATSESGSVVTNGMSNHARMGRNSNCALAVSVYPQDYGNTAMGAISFQRNIEKRAYDMAKSGGDYNAPIQTVGDFLSGVSKSDISDVVPTYMDSDPLAVTLCDLHHVLPTFVSSALEQGIVRFGRQIEGFDSPSAVLTAPETRTSSPVRIVRDERLTAIGYENLYPAGEGAGYAGGITSAAVDGIRCAMAVMEKYKPFENMIL